MYVFRNVFFGGEHPVIGEFLTAQTDDHDLASEIRVMDEISHCADRQEGIGGVDRHTAAVRMRHRDDVIDVGVFWQKLLLHPLYGSFEFLLEDGGLEEGYKAVLPRQMDASLMLVIDDGGGSPQAFALGQYIVSSGYDWTAPDLEDITVTLDYALTEIRLIISGWDSVYEYEMEI